MASGTQNPNRALSSAAAAAALRARPQTPTNVADVQTKRTMRRSPSVSSVGSAASAAARRSSQQPRLERKGSSSSMSERTFRSPSPHGDRKPLEPDHPPVPAIPSSHKVSRSTSSAGVGMQNFKTASQKMETGLPSWYTQPQGDISNLRTSDAPMTKPIPEHLTSVPQRPDSRSSSVNFSYPGRSRAQSPPASPVVDQNDEWTESPRQTSKKSKRSSVASSTVTTKPDQTLVYDPNSRRMVPKADLDAIAYQVQAASEKQPKSKKSQSGVSRSGSHLAKGTVGRTRGSLVETNGNTRELRSHEPSSTQTSRAIKDEPRTLQNTEVESVAGVPIDGYNKGHVSTSEQYEPRKSGTSPLPQEPQRLLSPRPVAQMGRKPSMVREESEDESGAEDIHIPSRDIYGALDSVPTRQTLYEPAGEQQTTLAAESELADYSTFEGSDGNPESLASTLESREQEQIPRHLAVSVAQSANVPQRSLSQSPARQARFASSPSDNLVVRHTPPGRSASPIKSALKHSPSPRDASPSDTSTSDAARARFSSPDRDASLPRKKSARVSFDDRSPVIVGESHGPVADTDSPIMPSPQTTRRPWYSGIGRNRKKDTSLDLEEDEVMKPRPALPSFGSVREKKVRDTEEQERPLIRPQDVPATTVARTYSPQMATESSMDTGLSSDYAIGTALSQAQDNAARNEANISRFREPLPPVVTSVDGRDDLSDSLNSSDDEHDSFNSAGDDSDGGLQASQTTAATVLESQPNSQINSTILEEKIPVQPEQPLAEAVPASTLPSQPRFEERSETVPGISITQPSPGLTEVKQTTQQYFDIPGMFPDDNSDESPAPQQTTSFPSSTADAMKEPEAVVIPSQTQVLPQTTLATTPQAAQPEAATDDDDSNASIYSDAYEDISDVDGDGFQSMDAVVESPVTKSSISSHAPETTAAGNTKYEEMEPTNRNNTVFAPAASREAPGNDWEHAKSFWRSLTAEKRRQLELEAMEDAGADGDHEEMQTPTRKLSNRTKKTAGQRQATAVAQAAHAQTTPPEKAKQKQMRPVDAERTYMIQPGSKANHEPLSPVRQSGHMRMSMRGQQPQPARTGTLTKRDPGEVHMRKSMRSDPFTDGNASHRASAPPERVASPRITRPRTAGGQDDQAVRHNKAASVAVAASAATAFSKTSKPAPQRRGSDASDSSFKRTRAAPSDSMAFRRTLRQERQDMVPARPRSPPEAVKGSSRFSLRSLSPSGSTFRRSSVAGPPTTMGMRRSLRSGSDSSKDSKRASLQFPSFGRASGKAAGKKTKAGTSRFGDSSDEDEPASRFRSRFDDSSDEEDARPGSSSRPMSKGTLRASATAPANIKVAAPVPEEEEASPDLPDSDDDDPSTQFPSPLRSPGNAAPAFRPDISQRTNSGIGTTTLNRQRSGPGTLATSVTAPVVTRERRSSFMSSILRRNKKADNAGKISRPELTESAARRDTKLERNTDELRNLRSDQRPHSPKLQKKNALTRGDSWPLPEPTDDVRPSTAGGRVNGAKVERPDFQGRRSTSLGMMPAQQPNGHNLGSEAIIEGPDSSPKKKKKFGALRKMFRLDD
ncbi:hypothetical protein PFICI_10580 [Pestalotiopsis fici W106-1]|uniref:Uncharacterized protein n=1 Tax=Pestalotiopsis fici (strain W106-1 / CGMCC3.15140) TaxID=1229662 RepID=W3WXB3_PESFW|nr:uncharacterized protein PFICI_10580 [Pestalotiopsis fici W106-1]ETS78518.1 hypothetical protein PFICI_10580 [Pestalotiopsis fici W106-1]